MKTLASTRSRLHIGMILVGIEEWPTLYDRMPWGSETEDRDKVNIRFNSAKFLPEETAKLERMYRYDRRHHPIKWFRRTFYDWLHDQFVLKYYLNTSSALDSINWSNKGDVVSTRLAISNGWLPSTFRGF